MKSKHIYDQSHTDLFKYIHKEIYIALDFSSKKFNRYIFIKCLVYFVVTGGIYMGLYLIVNPFVFIPTFACYGVVSLLFAFNFAHDFSHNTIFKNKRLNHNCFILLYTIVGAHAEAWKERHVQSHHHAPNVVGYDSDLEITSLIRVVPGSKLKSYHKYQYLYAPLLYTTYSLFWVFVKDFKIFYSKNNQTKTLKYKASFWFQKIGYSVYLFVLPMLCAHQKWYVVIIAFVIMHMIQSVFLLFTFFMTHHIEGMFYPKTSAIGVIQASWLMNQVKSSNDFYPYSKIANFIFGGFNNHIAHHLFPHIHHVYYPKLNRVLYVILRKHGLEPSQTSYLRGVWLHLLHLRQLGQCRE